MTKSISDLIVELENATEVHKDLRRKADVASMQACDALNAVNTAQKRLDAALEKLKQEAHRDTDWKRDSRG
jgi:hypothetical protein